MAIQKANGSTIVARASANYDPDTFDDLKDPRFMEVTADELLARIDPITFDFLPGKRFISMDTETFYTGIPSNRMPSGVVRRWIKGGSSKYIPNDFPFCISICDGKNAYAVYDTLQNKFAEFAKLKPLLADRSIDKVAHNFGFDLHMCANAKVDIKGRLHDTMHLSKIIDPEAFSHKLIDLSKHNPEAVVMYEYMVDSYKSRYRITDYRQIPRELMTQYTCGDVWNTLLYFKENYENLGIDNQWKLYETESEMLIVAYYMERTGVPVDLEYEKVIIPELEAEANNAEREIYELAGTVFNINSGKQLETVLKNLGHGNLIRYKKPTESMLAKGIVKGNACFDKNEMDRLENAGVTIVSKIMTYRQAEKLLNTFAVKLYEMCDFEGIVHCNINTIEAKTGRFSISMPSMQNMPRRKDSRIRGAFIAKPGYTLYDFDFKSQESIILVHYSKSEYLLEILRAGKDIHKAVASIIYTLDYNEISKELREIAKSVEFAIVYGAGPTKVAAMTGLSEAEASMVMKKFLKNAPEIDTFIRGANKIMKERGRIRTILNRVVCAERGREYACVNYVCQGSAADSTKTRMIIIHKFLFANKYKTRMILQVHDSLLQMVHDDEEHLLGKLRKLQTERELFRVPVLVDVAKCHPTWRDKNDIDCPEEDLTPEEIRNMEAYDIWDEGLLSI